MEEDARGRAPRRIRRAEEEGAVLPTSQKSPARRARRRHGTTQATAARERPRRPRPARASAAPGSVPRSTRLSGGSPAASRRHDPKGTASPGRAGADSGADTRRRDSAGCRRRAGAPPSAAVRGLPCGTRSISSCCAATFPVLRWIRKRALHPILRRHPRCPRWVHVARGTAPEAPRPERIRPARRAVNARRRPAQRIASASISTRIAGSTKPATWTNVVAGRTSPNTSAWARPTSGHSAASAR